MELEMAVRSTGPDVENGGLEVAPGDPCRCGIAMPRPPTVGDESGGLSQGGMVEVCACAGEIKTPGSTGQNRSR